MDKFEYQILEFNMGDLRKKAQSILNELGNNGWEVVGQSTVGVLAVNVTIFTLKRKLT